MKVGSRSRSLFATAAGALGAAMLIGGVLGAPEVAAATAVADPAAALRLLTPADAQRYTQGFAAMRRGDLIAGQTSEHGLADPSLIGPLEAVRLLHPAYRASYGELSGWLERYADLPEAPRVYDRPCATSPAARLRPTSRPSRPRASARRRRRARS